MRSLRITRIIDDRPSVALALMVAGGGMMLAACWGDDVPSLDQIGAQRTDGETVEVVFGACSGEAVQRVAVNRTDENFEEILEELWAIERDGSEPYDGTFVVGETPPGFVEVTPLGVALDESDHLQVVVTSDRQGTIPMSFETAALRRDEVLVRGSDYRSRAEFDDGIRERCDGG